MPFVFPRHDELLKSQRHLPAKDRQSKVLLEFVEAIPRRFVCEFSRIQLTRPMFGAGEGDFYEASLFQPHRVARVICPICKQPMDPISQGVSKCRNKRCELPDKWGRPSGRPTSQMEFHRGPLRGVIACITLPEFVVERTRRTAHGYSWVDEKVDRALLVLDRRYEKPVLAAVYRAANQVCETYGWKLK